jgi:hypothetical protein
MADRNCDAWLKDVDLLMLDPVSVWSRRTYPEVFTLTDRSKHQFESKYLVYKAAFKSVSMKQGCQVVIHVIDGRAGARASMEQACEPISGSPLLKIFKRCESS